MQFHSLRHLADGTVAGFVPAGKARIRKDVAVWIAYLAEFDRRRLFVPEGYSSLFDYCMGRLELSEDETCKYIRVTRAARRFPAIFEALADGRLHLTGAVLLARHLNPENANELLAAAAHRARDAIKQLLAERFPQPDVATVVQAIAPPDTAASTAGEQPELMQNLPAPGRVKLSTIEHDAGIANAQDSSAKVTPLAPQRFALQTTIEQATHDKLRYAQELLGAAIPSGDVAQVLDRALDALIRQLEKRRFGAGARPRAERTAKNSRRVPAAVRSTVWHRDGGRCTFTSDTGHRCEARKFLEFDHVEPVAKGGQSTVDNIRLRCRAHNQFAAERAFGPDFMRRKREQARVRRAETQVSAEAESARPEAAEHAHAVAAEHARAAADEVRVAAEAREAAERARSEVLPWLRNLGFRIDEARRAVELSAADPGAPLAERIRLALRQLAPRCASHTVSFAPGTA